MKQAGAGSNEHQHRIDPDLPDVPNHSHRIDDRHGPAQEHERDAFYFVGIEHGDREQKTDAGHRQSRRFKKDGPLH